MAEITLGGNPIKTSGSLPAVGSSAPAFTLVGADLSEKRLGDYRGKKLILNIFPSIDTSTCAASVRAFNEKAAALASTVVLCVSADLPFAQKRFCAAEGIENVETLSTFRSPDFGQDYGATILDGALANLLSRAIVVIDEDGTVVHTEQVGEIADEPDYDAALASAG